LRSLDTIIQDIQAHKKQKHQIFEQERKRDRSEKHAELWNKTWVQVLEKLAELEIKAVQINSEIKQLYSELHKSMSDDR